MAMLRTDNIFKKTFDLMVAETPPYTPEEWAIVKAEIDAQLNDPFLQTYWIIQEEQRKCWLEREKYLNGIFNFL